MQDFSKLLASFRQCDVGPGDVSSMKRINLRRRCLFFSSSNAFARAAAASRRVARSFARSRRMRSGVEVCIVSAE